MWKEDIFGSEMYAEALGDCGILSADEVAQIREGLRLVKAEWESGSFNIVDGYEDIQTAN